MHVDTAIACIIVLLGGVVPGASFFAALAAPFVALWLIVQLVIAARRRNRWRYLGTKVVAMAAVVALLFLLQAIYRPLARQAADDAFQATQAWHDAHGAWPRTLEEAGIGDAARLKRWRVHYLGEGRVMYPSTFNAFDRWYRAPGESDWTFSVD